MNKHLLYLVGIFFLCSTDSFSQNLDWKLKLAPRARHVSAGHILKTGETFIFGGNPSNDSIQFIGHSTDSGNTWGIKIDAPFKPKVNDANFVTEDIAFAVGDAGSILKSIDAGKNWSAQSVVANLRTRQFQGIHNITADTAYIVGGNLSNDSITTILRTVNGGTNWQKKMDKPGSRLNDVHFFKSSLGIAVGDMGAVYMTNDGGATWGPKTIPGNAGSRTFSAARFINETTIIIIGGNRTNDSIQTIIKSTDAGNTWQVIKDNISPMLLDIDFLDDGATGIAVGDHGVAYSTSDTGNTWAAINLPMNNKSALNSINYINAKNAIIGGQFGAVYLAHDQNALFIHNVSAQRSIIVSNPVNQYAKIVGSKSFTNFLLHNTMGVKMALTVSENHTILDFSHMSAGIYILTFNDQNGQSFYQKIQKL